MVINELASLSIENVCLNHSRFESMHFRYDFTRKLASLSVEIVIYSTTVINFVGIIIKLVFAPSQILVTANILE